MRAHPIASILSAVLALGFGLASASTAAALDTKVYQASACKAGNSAVSYIVNSNDYSLTNTYNLLAGFDCPVVRDEVGATTPLSATVWVKDTSTTQVVECRLFSRNPNGGLVTWQLAQSGVAFTGEAQLNLSLPTVGNANGNAYHLACLLPPGSSIRGYKIVESTQTP